MLTAAHCLYKYRDQFEIYYVRYCRCYNGFLYVERIFMWYKMPSTVNDYYVRVGDNVMEVEDEEEQELAILKIDFHENYNVGPEYNNDIAVVHIDRAKHPHGIRFGDKVVPVCLPQVRSQKYFSPTLRNIFPG